MQLEVYGSRLLVLCDEMNEKVGSIIMPGKHAERSRTARVLSVGDKVEHYQAGDKILISWYTGVHLHLPGHNLFDIPVDEDRHRMIMESEILGKIIE